MKTMFFFLVVSISMMQSDNAIRLDTPLDDGAQYGWSVDLSGDFMAIGGPGYYHQHKWLYNTHIISDVQNTKDSIPEGMFSIRIAVYMENNVWANAQRKSYD